MLQDSRLEAYSIQFLNCMLQDSRLEAYSIQFLNCMLQDSRLEAYSIQLKAAAKTTQAYTSLRYYGQGRDLKIVVLGKDLSGPIPAPRVECFP